MWIEIERVRFESRREARRAAASRATSLESTRHGLNDGAPTSVIGDEQYHNLPHRANGPGGARQQRLDGGGGFWDWARRTPPTRPAQQIPPQPDSQQRLREEVLGRSESLTSRETSRTSQTPSGRVSNGPSSDPERQRQSPTSAPPARFPKESHTAMPGAPSWARGLFWASGCNEASARVTPMPRPSSGWFWAEGRRRRVADSDGVPLHREKGQGKQTVDIVRGEKPTECDMTAREAARGDGREKQARPRKNEVEGESEGEGTTEKREDKASQKRVKRIREWGMMWIAL